MHIFTEDNPWPDAGEDWPTRWAVLCNPSNDQPVFGIEREDVEDKYEITCDSCILLHLAEKAEDK